MKIYFIGIGGIGVSALAGYYLEKGHKVSGSDLVSTEITKNLKRKGAKVFIGNQKSENLSKDTDLVIYSPAVREDNLELKTARKYKIKCQTYPQALGELTKKHFTIAITGTHGKSTTSAMLSVLLVEAGLDPTVIIGTKVKEFGNSNYRVGNSKYLIIEACEYKESFLNYFPKVLVINNIEADHLDYYKNIGNILKAFKKFTNNLSNDGVLVINKEDKNIKKIINTKTKIKDFSLYQKDSKKLKKILKVPGEYNIYNALAALTVARILEIPDEISFKALSMYKGCWRRFDEEELKINNYKLKVINDYAHHPTEIKNSLEGIREKYPKKEILCIFQPHQYQRTFSLFNDFVDVFKNALIDKIIIIDIYSVAGRESEIIKKKVSSKKLVKAINKKNVIYIEKKEILNYLKENLVGKEVLTIVGAGDIYDIFHP